MFSIPQLATENALEYLRQNYSGSYKLLRQFDGEAEYELPAVIVGANIFSEIHPGCGVYKGTLTIGIYTQIDSVESPTLIHDSETNLILQKINDRETFFDFFNSQDKGHIWGLINTSYGTDRADRYIFTIAEYEIHVQALKLQ